MTTGRRRDTATVRRVMQGNRSSNTKPERILRSELHRRGIRYRVDCRDLIGRPDIAIRKYRFAVFVDGDFWHGNRWRLRGLNRLEDDFNVNRDFWVQKIRRNIRRDHEVNEALRAAGWTVVRVWESQVKEDPVRVADQVVDALARTCSTR